MDTESTGQDQDESTTQSTDERAQGSRVEDVSGADARELEWQFEAADLKRIESWLEEEQDDQYISLYLVDLQLDPTSIQSRNSGPPSHLVG